ncbi:alpha-glucosidase C-terminal domain-containing protein [candidate division KSB1 bacterium]|nr:alpha-glucosidase C-terminal domain-containing protein [candidate division KSB1 bacterium]
MFFRIKLFSLAIFVLILSGSSFATDDNPHRDKLLTLLQFAEAPAPDSQLVPFEFEFHHQLSAQDSGVGINGSFNGWGDVYKCRNIGNDTWILVLYLAPGKYQYKFVTYIDTVGQAGVTGWYTDVLNPEYGGPYRDSYLTVKDPMIYYFQPVNKSEINFRQPEMTAKISYSLKNPVKPETITFSVDGINIPDAWKYYQPDSRHFAYIPAEKLEIGSHQLKLSVKNSAGTGFDGETQFTILKGIVEAPYELQFDAQSPVLDLVHPVEKVKFEWMDEPQTHDLSDSDGDRIYTHTLNLRVNRQRIYRVVVNDDIYLEMDPTNPFVSEEFRSIARKVVDPQPIFVDFSPLPGTIFLNPDTTINFLTKIVPGDSSYSIDLNSIQVLFNNQSVQFKTELHKDTVYVLFNQELQLGRNEVRFAAADEIGVPAHPANLTIGAYLPNTGVHYVDPSGDDTGTGTFTYPASTKSGVADIQAVHLSLNSTLDSINCVIEMKDIADFTRVGFGISNQTSKNLVDAPDNLELRIPEWENNGIFIILAAPNSGTFRSYLDNQILKSINPLQTVMKIQVNADASLSNHFHFQLAIADLETYLGTFNQKWFFTAYSYLVNQNGSVEISPNEGGLIENDEPDVYDLAFCVGSIAQSHLLKNYIRPNQLGGPRVAAIGSEMRGAIELSGVDLNPTFGVAPLVKIFAQSGKIYQEKIRIVGQVDDVTISSVDFIYNKAKFTLPVENQFFEKTIQLTPGLNSFYAEVSTTSRSVSRSRSVIYDYVVDLSPIVKIETMIDGKTVTFDGSQSITMNGTSLKFSWRQDETNPVQVVLSSKTTAKTSFDAPTKPGEYFFTLIARAGSETGWARAVVVVDETVHTVDQTEWHPAWVDSMVLYEIYVRTFSLSGKLSAIKDRIKSLKDFGINCIWLMPIHPSPSTHGYWITDYYGINPEYGTLNDFRDLVLEAHKYNIKVIIDLVINHTVDTHPFMRDALQNGEYSPFRDFYYWKNETEFEYLYSWVNLPSINYSTAWVQDYLINMCKWWVKNYNIDGFRCDVAHAIEKFRPEGAAFWQRWRKELKEIKPDIFLLAEAAASDPAYFDKKFDSAYDYWFYNEKRNALSGVGGADKLHEVVLTHLKDIPSQARPMRYIENHDESRFLTSYSLAQAKLAAALDFTLPGIPIIYAGQETGELASRGLVHWSDSKQLTPFYQRLISLRKRFSALSTGSYTALQSENQNIYAFLRQKNDENFLILANLSANQQEAELRLRLQNIPFDTTQSFYLVDRLTDTSIPAKGAELLNYKLTLEPNQISVFEFSNKPTDIKKSELTPYHFGLQVNYPNPFNSETTIKFSVGGATSVDTKIEIYNSLGQKVRTLLNESLKPGNYQTAWKGVDEMNLPISTGIYYCRFQSGNFVKTIKMLHLK